MRLTILFLFICLGATAQKLYIDRMYLKPGTDSVFKITGAPTDTFFVFGYINKITNSANLSTHIHAESEVTNLVSDLAGKSASGHTHAYNALTGLPTIPDSTSFQTKYRSDTARNNLYTSLASKQASGNYLLTNGSATSLTNFPTLNQNTSGTAAGLSANITESQVTNLTTDLSAKEPAITVLSFAKGGISGAAATSATTGTMTVNMTTSIITITPSGACTFNGSGGVAGQMATFMITTSGTSSFILTWGTNFKTTATLATGTTTAKVFCVSFLCTNGTQWVETARTAAM